MRATFPDTSHPTAAADHDRVPSFSLHCVSVRSIKKAIRKIKNTNALGVDGIPVIFWKNCVDTLALPVTHMVNSSIQTAIVPAVFKRAIVHPVYKGGNKDQASPSSYRPVAVLPALSKVLERIVCDQLGGYLEDISCHWSNTASGGGAPSSQRWPQPSTLGRPDRGWAGAHLT